MTKVLPFNCVVQAQALTSAMQAFEARDFKRTFGMEMERFVLTKDGRLPDAAMHQEFFLGLSNEIGDKVSVETGAHMIEIKTGVHTRPDELTGEMESNLALLKRQASLRGLDVVPSSALRGFTTMELSQNLVARRDPVTGAVRRAYELPLAYVRAGHDHVTKYNCSTISAQVTHAVPNLDSLHRWARVHSALSPLYYTVFENRSRREGERQAALAARRTLGPQGLVAPYVFEASDCDDFVRRYMDAVKNTPMLSMLDAAGNDVIQTGFRSFAQLPAGAQTLGNLMQAASLRWNVCKIRAVINQDALDRGRVELDALLVEARDMDASDAAIPIMADLFAAMTDTSGRLDELEKGLEACGLPILSHPAQALSSINATLSVVEASPCYLDAPYGAGRLRDVVTNLVAPMMADASTSAAWGDIARSRRPIFEVNSGSAGVFRAAPLDAVALRRSLCP